MPPGFSGAVGRFKATATLDRDTRPARRGGDAALPRRGHRQPQVDRPRAGGPAERGEGVPAADEERPARERDRRERLADLGVRGGARDERRDRDPAARLFLLRRGGREDRERRNDAAHAAGRRRHGRRLSAGRSRRVRVRARHGRAAAALGARPSRGVGARKPAALDPVRGGARAARGALGAGPGARRRVSRRRDDLVALGADRAQASSSTSRARP